uniref:Uncharacterized protein n=1 Tax=candidate division WOR-3 bacterium TaxID=2052148 RepID=A0A7C4TBN8_UNCW3
MKIFLIALITITFLFCAETDIEMIMNRVASRLNVTLPDLKIEKDDLDFYGYGKFRTKLFDLFINNPLKIDPYISTLSRTILNNSDSLWAISYFPWARIDEGVRRGLIERPDETLTDSLPKGEALNQKLFEILQSSYQTDTTGIAGLPEVIRIGIFLILTEIKNSIDLIQKGTEDLSVNDAKKIIQQLIESGEDGLSNPHIENLLEQIDFKAIAAGAMDLSYVLQTAIDLMREESLEKTIKLNTTYGLVVLGSKESDKYDPLPYLLIIDFGGDDTYISSGASDKNHPVSIIIDYSGNDRYTGEIGCGTGIAGIGFVIDLEGNDKYSAEKIGLGTGIFGQGIILDIAGDDEYTTDIYGLGAGLFGTGVISDLSGNDRYIGFQGCQGFGFVKGCGLLIDKEGNDTYIARDDTVKYSSPQTEEHNVSLAQGVGFGIRADFTDGHSLAGGVGMLIDGEGDDKYSCGVFGQGCGYWFGLGFLIDYNGNDEYNGVWYVQGSGAHFALGFLRDSTGNDKYNAKMNMAQGAGHDFTLGILFDYEGNDYYDAPNLSLGAGNANGMGLFIDFSGDDDYLTHSGITLGRANTASRGSLRDFMKTIGIFIDGAGKDKYSEIGANKKIWIQKPPLQMPLKSEWSIGIDF